MPNSKFARAIQAGISSFMQARQMFDQLQTSALQRELYQAQKANIRTPEQEAELRLKTGKELEDYRQGLQEKQYEPGGLMDKEYGAKTRLTAAERERKTVAAVGYYGNDGKNNPKPPEGYMWNIESATMVPDTVYELRLRASPKGGGGGRGSGDFDPASQKDITEIIERLGAVMDGYGLQGVTISNVPEDILKSAYNKMQNRVLYDTDGNPVPMYADPASAISDIYAWVVTNDEQVAGYLNRLNPEDENDAAVLASIKSRIEPMIRNRVPIAQISTVVKDEISRANSSGQPDSVLSGLPEREQALLRGWGKTYGPAIGAWKGIGKGAAWLYNEYTKQFTDPEYKNIPQRMGEGILGAASGAASKAKDEMGMVRDYGFPLKQPSTHGGISKGDMVKFNGQPAKVVRVDYQRRESEPTWGPSTIGMDTKFVLSLLLPDGSVVSAYESDVSR